MRELLAKYATVDEGFQVYNLDGQLQMSIPLSTTAKYGAERLIFHRIDLHEALKQRATGSPYPGTPARIIVSSRAVSCDCEAGIVTLQDGSEVQGDLIIGADGIKSAMRQAVLGYEVSAQKTGHSAYRMVIPSAELANEAFTKVVDPTKPFTTMVMGHDKRLIMGPARNGTIYSIVAMVPDETMKESSDSTSWTTPGDLKKMLETFADFPEWAKVPLKLAKEAGLWQLRDIDPLPKWHKSRVILIGDSAHAMLPTQGQGASQSIEDAEAVGSIFADDASTPREVERLNKLIFDCRFSRASLIQGYSRQTAKPATQPGNNRIKMNPAEFMDYNCKYDGARNWLAKAAPSMPLTQKVKVGASISEVTTFQ